MLTTEQVKEIAEYVGLEFKCVDRTGVRVRCYGFDLLNNKFNYTRLFNPKSNGAYAMLVFKALVDECKKQGVRLNSVGGLCAWKVLRSGERKTIFFNDEFNNESICLAYLAVMESK